MRGKGIKCRRVAIYSINAGQDGRGKKQVIQYGNALEQKYDNIRLKRYAVVSLGFERLWWVETASRYIERSVPKVQ
ncbi:MAG: hypothetical protein HF982_09865 [Desulfobacteraceae bacterium]|nr:hypothetical protein [Desulfobacteraceae bacterium]MBC2719872.1 hypothetical protein [Desulfobacteraceae bacterium]